MWNCSSGGHRRPVVSPPLLPLLQHVRTLEATDWLRESLTTFARSVASFLPGDFEAYARLYHPWQPDRPSAAPAPTWRELAAAAGVDPNDPVACESLIWSPERQAHVNVGSVPRAVIDPLVEHLRTATTTPERCWFAVWEGFGDSVVPPGVEPTLELPHRRYHVFTGPIEGALTSHSAIFFAHQSVNLWWPADHAWCVATEVDHAWTYVGAARSCIRALLADARFEAVETTATARW
jgi:hypothetical protein